MEGHVLTRRRVSQKWSFQGRGKQCRLLSTVGVARSLGDHDLLAKGCGIRIKEFMTPAPEVRVLDLSTLNGQEFLVMGTDGLWDVLSLREVQQVISEDGDAGPQVLAQQLVRKKVTLTPRLIKFTCLLSSSGYHCQRRASARPVLGDEEQAIGVW